MATTGIFNGTNLVVLVGTEVIAHATSCSLSISADLPDATTKQSGGWADEISGLRSWSLTTDGLTTVEPTGTNYVVGDLSSLITGSGRASVLVKFTTVNGSTPIVGDLIWSGQAFLESLDITADMESPVTYSASFTGTGQLTQAANVAP
jgi:predicted secreted protein